MFGNGIGYELPKDYIFKEGKKMNNKISSIYGKDFGLNSKEKITAQFKKGYESLLGLIVK